MSARTEGEALAEAYRWAKISVMFYLNRMPNADWKQEFTLNGHSFPSVYWIVAHLCESSNWLCLRGTGATPLDIPWEDEYGFGTRLGEAKQQPPQEEVLVTLDKVQTASMMQIATLSSDDLDKDNLIDFKLGDDPSQRMIINHAIRHQNMHAGHLGWLLQMHASTK